MHAALQQSPRINVNSDGKQLNSFKLQIWWSAKHTSAGVACWCHQATP